MASSEVVTQIHTYMKNGDSTDSLSPETNQKKSELKQKAGELHALLNKHRNEGEFALRGADEATVERVEKELKIRLPDSYRTYLQTYGAGGVWGMYVLGCETDSLDVSVVQTFKKYKQQGMPAGLVPIFDLEEVQYCLHTYKMNSEGECPVVVWSPQQARRHHFVLMYPNFTEFLLRYIKEAEAKAREEGLLSADNEYTGFLY